MSLDVLGNSIETPVEYKPDPLMQWLIDGIDKRMSGLFDAVSTPINAAITATIDTFHHVIGYAPEIMAASAMNGLSASSSPSGVNEAAAGVGLSSGMALPNGNAITPAVTALELSSDAIKAVESIRSQGFHLATASAHNEILGTDARHGIYNATVIGISQSLAA